jgi:stage IV sporulation protein FB
MYPFGGHIVFDEDINKPLKEEFLILISGPIFQMILFFIVSILYNFNIINIYTYNVFFEYHYTILFFNLIPIYPLDGSKILNIIFNNFLPFKESHKLTIYLSYIFIIVYFIFLYSNINLLILLVILSIKVIKEHKDHNFIFNKFLLERYLKDIKHKFNHLIKGERINKIRKNRNNLFKVNNKIYNEKKILKKRFTKKV